MSSNKERQKRYRQNHGEEYKEKNRVRMRQKRQNLSVTDKEEDKTKARERMQVKREKEIRLTNLDDDSFQSPQSLGKAVAKAERNLPKDRNRRIAVLTELCRRDNLSVGSHQSPQFKGTTSRDTLYTIVEDFYNRDDISQQTPGLKETVYVKDLKTKVCGINTQFQLSTMMLYILYILGSETLHALVCRRSV
jgi:hypothetical protein